MAVDIMGMQEYTPFTEGSIKAMFWLSTDTNTI